MVIIMTPEVWNRLLQDRLLHVYVDKVADEAIREAMTYMEVEELRRIAEL